MTYQCVQIATIAGTSQEVIVPAADCSTGLMLVDPSAAIALAQNPLNIPLDAAPELMLATVALFVVAYTAKAARRALD